MLCRASAGDGMPGALDVFIAEVIGDHIRENVIEAVDPDAAKEAAKEMIGIVHSYLA